MNENYDAHIEQELPSLVKGAGFRSQYILFRRFKSYLLHHIFFQARWGRIELAKSLGGLAGRY